MRLAAEYLSLAFSAAVSSEAKDLVKRMMDPDPKRRLSAKEALQHTWVVKHAGTSDHFGQTATGLEALKSSVAHKGDTCVVS